MSSPHPAPDNHQASLPRKFSWGAVVIGIILIPPNVYWVIRMEALPDKMHPTLLAIFFTSVFTLLVLVGLNRLVLLVAPRFAFHQSHLLLIYSMVCIGSAMSGCDMMQRLVPVMNWSFWMADPTNKYDTLFNPDIPTWTTVRDPNILRGFYEGGVSPYRPHILSA